jgi:hypothetical protein
MRALSSLPPPRPSSDRARRVPIGPPLLLAGIVVLGVLAMGSATHVVRLAAPAAVPSVAPRVPDTSPRYFDRQAQRTQSVVPPDLVRRILLPSLGAPAQLAPSSTFAIVLDAPLAPGEQIALVPRDALAELDELLYALPPMPAGAKVIDARKTEAEAELAGARERTMDEAEQGAFIKRFGDAGYQKKLDELLAAVADESGDDVRARIGRMRERFDAIARSRAKDLVAITPRGACERIGIGDACAFEAEVPRDLPVGLYAIAIRGANGAIADFQMNAAYRPRAPDAPPEFVVAADMQWGDNPQVAGNALGFISLMNALAASERPPESILLAGDIVDCEFGSAGSAWTKLFGGAADYPRDYMQAWLVVAALRIPAHIIPGNHDGYRFEDAVGQTRADGLLLFESTFGPLFHSFDRPPFRVVMLNSFDLPQDNRTPRTTEASSILERFSDKLNVLNWGGGVSKSQLAWLRARLGLDGAPMPSGLTPLLVMHQDPRGACIVLKQRAFEKRALWNTQRHVPFGESSRDLRALQSTLTPHSSETEEIHAGYYTPLRDGSSEIRSTEWFEIGGANVTLPPTSGFPGWARYQQEWHSPGTYRKDFFDVHRVATARDLAAPVDVLAAIAEGKVAAILKGHDNRFGRAHMQAGESVFGAKAERELKRYGDDDARRALFERVRLRAPLGVYATADISDFDSDGHGFLWVRVKDGEPEVLEIDHR